MTGKEEYIYDPSDMEDRCIAMRAHNTFVYFYPYRSEVAKTGAKCVTRDGRTVRGVKIGTKGGFEVVIGKVDGEEHEWDIAGRHDGPYKDSPLDIFIAHRYFFKDWQLESSMSHVVWNAKHHFDHPTVELPKPKIENVRI